jgi:hypothetical protein
VTEQRINPRELHDQYERLEMKVAAAERDVETASRLGNRQILSRARARLDRYDAELNRLHGLLHPIAYGSIYEAGERHSLQCSRCPYIFRDRAARFAAVGLCSRCDGSGRPLDPDDPNWSPLYDDLD